MDPQNRTQMTPRPDCSDEGYRATHGWDNKNDGMQIPVTMWGPSFKQGVELPRKFQKF